MRAAAIATPSTAPVASSKNRPAAALGVTDRRRRRRPLPDAAAASCSSAGPAATTTSGLGELTVRPLRREDVGAAAVVLARAFADGSSRPLSDVEGWLRESLDGSGSKATVLIAELVPDDEKLLPPGKQYRVAGVAAVATTPEAAAAAVGGEGLEKSENSSPLLPLRYSSPLLCNVAVDPRLKRKGVGSALVEAAERIVEAKELFVVARGGGDEAAEKLYCSRGFVEVVGDEKGRSSSGGGFGGLSSLFGGGAKKKGADKLMRKEL